MGATTQQQHRGKRRFGRGAGISDRERIVLQSLANGRTTIEAADDLHLSPHTIRTYLQTGMRKLDAHTRAHAVAIALSRGLISGPPDES